MGAEAHLAGNCGNTVSELWFQGTRPIHHRESCRQCCLVSIKFFSRMQSSNLMHTVCTEASTEIRANFLWIATHWRYCSQALSKRSRLLNEKERDDIQQLLSTPIRANEQLLNILMLKDDRAYSCFLTSLIETDQEHITEIFNSEDTSLKSEHSFMIQRNYSMLVEDLNVDSGLLLDRLFASGVITTREMDSINTKPTKHKKSEELLSLVSKFSSNNFEKFLKALEESSQAHVVSIMTGKFSSSTEINICTATADESNTPCKETKVKEKFPKKLELKGDSNHDLRNDKQQNGRHCIKITKTSSFHGKRQSIKTLGSRFANLPDELQTELSLKVAALHQTTFLPSVANVEICFHKLRQGYIQQKKEVYRKQTEVEDMREILRRVNYSEQNSTHAFEGIFQKEIQILKEELLLHRTNNRHLDETLKTRDIALDNAIQKIGRIERQLEQCHNELMTLARNRDGLRKKLDSAHQFVDKFKTEIRVLNEELLLHTMNNDHLNETLKTRDIELDNEKQKIRGLERQLEQCHNERMTLARQKDDLRKKLDSAHQLEDKFKKEIRVLNEDLLLHRKNNDHLNEMLKTRDIELDNEKQKSRGLEKQLEQCHIELTTLVGQREELDATLKLRDESKKKLEILLSDKDIEFADEKEKSSELRTQLDQFQMESAELLKQRDRLQRELVEQRYRSDPVLVQTIRTKAAEEEEDTYICGLAILDNELFVVHQKSTEVEVYDSNKLSFCRQLTLKELIYPFDIVSCNGNKCVYISDYKYYYGQSSEILRVDPDGNVIKNWSTGRDEGLLSVTHESTVIITFYTEGKFNEYSPDGQLIREIYLSTEGIRHLWHAIQLTSGRFVVSHVDGGDYDDDLHRVCIVDGDGKLMKSFGEQRGSAVGQLNRPAYLSVDANGFVIVADQMNHRVLLLNPDLEFKKEILSNEKHGLLSPWRILLDESNGRLFVTADDESGNEGILVFDL